MIKFLLLALVGVCAAEELEKRIVNGEPAEHGSHPHQATLQLYSGGYWYHICGGSLIAPNKVLTAAHCLDGQSRYNLRVGLGWYQLTKSSGSEQTFSVSSISVHRNYNPNGNGYPNDIAVITLSGEATLNQYVQLAKLAPEDSSFAYQSCVISGWGQLSGNGGSADILKQASITKITNKDCTALWSGVPGAAIYNSHICVYEQPKSSCSGDSGGPMICDGYLAGVTSWGVSTCDGTFPSVYVRVSEYLLWIQRQI